jgi:hypothetical protein
MNRTIIKGKIFLNKVILEGYTGIPQGKFR